VRPPNGGAVALLLALFARSADMAHAAEVVVSHALECQPIEVTSGGEVRFDVQGTTRNLMLRGVIIAPDAASAVNWLFDRIRRNGIAMRCTLPPDSTIAPESSATVEYMAWRDKSGDVWQDLGLSLIDEGLARVAPGDFPRRDEYAERERKAKAARRGLWGEQKRGGVI